MADMSLAAGGASGRSGMRFTRNTDFAAQLAIRSAIRRDIGDVVGVAAYEAECAASPASVRRRGPARERGLDVVRDIVAGNAELTQGWQARAVNQRAPARGSSGGIAGRQTLAV